MEYAESKFKQLAVEYALKLEQGAGTAEGLVESAKIIEEYLKSGS